jgi:hypothetical protein
MQYNLLVSFIAGSSLPDCNDWWKHWRESVQYAWRGNWFWVCHFICIYGISCIICLMVKYAIRELLVTSKYCEFLYYLLHPSTHLVSLVNCGVIFLPWRTCDLSCTLSDTQLCDTFDISLLSYQNVGQVYNIGHRATIAHWHPSAVLSNHYVIYWVILNSIIICDKTSDSYFGYELYYITTWSSHCSLPTHSITCSHIYCFTGKYLLISGLTFLCKMR